MNVFVGLDLGRVDGELLDGVADLVGVDERLGQVEMRQVSIVIL